MSKNPLKQIIGLTERESAVYQAILIGGRLTQSDIAKTTRYNRTSLYPYLKNLLLKDLISKSMYGKRTVYSANNPEKLLKNATAATRSLESVLPTLLTLFKQTNHQPRFSLHEGSDAMYAAMFTFFQTASSLKSFASPDNFLQVLTRSQASGLISIIEKRDIQMCTLTSHTKQNLAQVQTFHSPNLTWRPMPKELSYSIEVTFSHQAVMVISWQHHYLIQIDSVDVAAFIAVLHNYFWKKAT